jgi:hypothetical protein
LALFTGSEDGEMRGCLLNSCCKTDFFEFTTIMKKCYHEVKCVPYSNPLQEGEKIRRGLEVSHDKRRIADSGDR